ncbi:MAG: acyl-CoA dehydrogenase family protein [Acidimicrobiales bacterium]
MDFELSDDQVALRDAARDLLDAAASPERVRAHVDAGGGLSSALWEAMVDQGWAGIAVPEDLGGVGLGWVEVAVLAEQVGAHVAPAPFVQHAVALDALVGAVRRGIEGAAAVLEPLAAGTSIATVAWSAVDARRRGDRWSLTGRTEPAVFAPVAGVAIVRGRDGDEGDGAGDLLFAVDLDEVGRPERQPAMDLTREVGWLSFDAAPAVLLGGGDAVQAHLDAGASALAAELLGVGARSLDLAVDYAKEREQFGRPIGSFQAVKHRCADMLVDVEGMRSVAYHAAWCHAAGDADAAVAASTAKTWCSDAATRVTASALQVHGGIGFTWECDVHLFVKRAQLDRTSFGDAAYHRDRLGRLLRAKVAAGESVI